MNIQADAGATRLKVARAAAKEEKEAIFRLRYQVSVEEMGQRPKSADHERKRVTDAIDDEATILYVTDGSGEPLASLRIVGATKVPNAQEVHTYALDRLPEVDRKAVSFTSRLVVSPKARGMGAVGMLLNEVYTDRRNNGMWFDCIQCSPSLVALYEVMGYRRFVPTVMETDVGLRVPMALVADDVEHLARVRSPLLSMAERFKNDTAHGTWFAKRFSEYATPAVSRAMTPDEFWRYLAERIHIEDYPLLRDLSGDERKQVLNAGNAIRVDKGSAALRAGDPGSDMYMVLSGVLEVRANTSDGGSHVMETLGKGQIFGEMGFLSSRPRSADVVAVTDAEILVITRDFLERLTRDKPAVASRMLMNLSLYLVDRLQNTTRGLVDMTQQRNMLLTGL